MRRRPETKQKHKAKPASTTDHISLSEESDGAFGVSSRSHDKGWIVDSGASSHVTQRRELLMEYEQFEKPQKVWLGDGRSVEAIRKGNIQFTMYFKMRQSKNVTMYNALYVPKLTCNLFSVRATAARGNSVSFGDTQCVVYDRHGKLLGNGSLIERLYYLNCDTPVPEEKVTIATGCQMENKIDLWHRRTGHLNESQLKEMASQDIVKGIHIPKNIKASFCESCVEGKMAKKPFKLVGAIRSTKQLQCVHSDVCGPMTTESIGGKRYFVTFTDDYSRCCRVYFMTRKSEVFDKFKEFELRTTNECGHTINILRSDNGGEYISKEFQSYLMSKGIHHELTAPYYPAQNGTAERINQTLMESARTMMPDKYRAEAVATAAYLQNRVLTRSLSERMTPYEKWYGRKPDLSHLKVFGCMAYAYIPDIHRNGKLSKKAEKLRFVGYSLQTKGYRLINEDTGKVVISRDVIFNESDFLFKPMAIGTGGRLPVSSDSVLNDDQDVSEQDAEGQEELQTRKGRWRKSLS